MDIRGTKLFQRLHEWLAREPVYKLMREDRDSLMEDMRVIADAICGKPDMRPGELLLKISDLKAEAAFGRGCLEHGHALGIDPTKELGQQYRALRRDAESWRALWGGQLPAPPRRMVRNPEATCGNCPYCDKGAATEGRDSCAVTHARGDCPPG